VYLCIKKTLQIWEDVNYLLKHNNISIKLRKKYKKYIAIFTSMEVHLSQVISKFYSSRFSHEL